MDQSIRRRIEPLAPLPDPDATPDEFAQFMGQFPKLVDQLNKAWEEMNAEAKAEEGDQ